MCPLPLVLGKPLEQEASWQGKKRPQEQVLAEGSTDNDT
jgi:hypothetical protein